VAINLSLGGNGRHASQEAAALNCPPRHLHGSPVEAVHGGQQSFRRYKRTPHPWTINYKEEEGRMVKAPKLAMVSL